MRTIAAVGGRQEVAGVSKADERLAEMYSLHAAKAVRLAYLLTRDRQAAEDVAQESFVRLGGKLATLRDPERAAGYLLRTVANLSKDHGRRVVRARRLDPTALSPSAAPAVDVELRDEVLRAMMMIPHRYRLVLFLRYYLDMSEQQAATSMGCSRAAVKALTNRAARAVRQQLGGSDG